MNLLTLFDIDTSTVEELITEGISLKGLAKKGIPHRVLEGKVLGLIFEKPSTRTRVSFEAAMFGLGGHTVFISGQDSQVGRGEPVKDTARVISSYVDGVIIRTFAHSTLEEFAEYSSVPVINGLTDSFHPCQVLADLLTIEETFGSVKDKKIAWIGDGNNMAHSWIAASALLGFELIIACPDGYKPSDEVLKKAEKIKGGTVTVTDNVQEAVKGAHVINTDVWTSMGQEEENAKRLEAFEGYQVNQDVLKLADSKAIVLHCLPAHRGEEITSEVLEGTQSKVWEQAENRLHIQKAILKKLLS